MSGKFNRGRGGRGGRGNGGGRQQNKRSGASREVTYDNKMRKIDFVEPSQSGSKEVYIGSFEKGDCKFL